VKLNTDFKNQKNNQTTCIRPEVLETNVVPAPLNTRQTSMAFFMKNILSVIAMAVVLCLGSVPSSLATTANWVTLVTNTAASNPVVFVDNHATNSSGFYRVGRLPNP
jgi:hypothetical protein